MKNIEDKIWDLKQPVEIQIGFLIHAQARYQVWHHIRSQTQSQIGDQVYLKVRNQVWNQVQDQLNKGV